MGDLVPEYIVLFSVVAVLGLAYYHRKEPEWQAAMPRIRILLIGQIALAALLAIVNLVDKSP